MTRYEYDAERSVMLKIEQGKAPRIISKNEPHWRALGADDEQYARALFLGQGCWERLESVSEETAAGILQEWGCTAADAE